VSSLSHVTKEWGVSAWIVALLLPSVNETIYDKTVSIRREKAIIILELTWTLSKILSFLVSGRSQLKQDATSDVARRLGLRRRRPHPFRDYRVYTYYNRLR
jgi:hypothetical protein